MCLRICHLFNRKHGKLDWKKDNSLHEYFCLNTVLKQNGEEIKCCRDTTSIISTQQAAVLIQYIIFVVHYSINFRSRSYASSQWKLLEIQKCCYNCIVQGASIWEEFKQAYQYCLMLPFLEKNNLLFICYLFKDGIASWDYIASNDVIIIAKRIVQEVEGSGGALT
jgi:hypothetical protein